MQPPRVPVNDGNPTTSTPFPGSLTPGWNDPPPLKENLTPERRRLNLNKRVAFPMHSGGTNQTSVTPPILPHGLPITAMTSTQILHVPTNSEISTVANDQLSTESLPVNALDQIMEKLNESLNRAPETQHEEIKRCLHTVQELWQTNKYAEVKLILFQLCQALNERNYQKSMDLYEKLQTESINQSSSWSSPLRHIISTLQETQGC